MTTDPKLLAAATAAIAAALPDFANAALIALPPGFDSRAYAASRTDGCRFVFKFPRTAPATVRLRREVAVLAHLRPRVALPVPDLRLIDGPAVFSVHPMLPGRALLPDEYPRLSATAKDRLAQDLAQFAAEAHAIPPALMAAAGAGCPPLWRTTADIREIALPCLAPSLREKASAALDAFDALPPDPLGQVFGQFDGHGWNMAFDHEAQRLNGLFDFSDSGIGPVHQDFIYAAFVSPDLTDRMISAYARITTKPVDRARVRLLSGIYRLHELANAVATDARPLPMIRNVGIWAAWQG